jgi:hypothetical protein
MFRRNNTSSGVWVVLAILTASLGVRITVSPPGMPGLSIGVTEFAALVKIVAIIIRLKKNNFSMALSQSPPF